MNLYQQSKALSNVFNTLGNQWIEEHLGEEPFLFRVYLRKPGHDEEHLGSLIAEVYTDRFIPKNMIYMNNGRRKKVTHEFLRKKLKEMSKYIQFEEPIEIKLMEVDYR